MAQHDYIIANQSGAAFRSDLNNGLAAIVSQNSGAAQPSTTYAYQWWADTATGLLKIRNAANNAWITIGTLADANLGLLSLAGGTLTGALLADDSGTAALPAIAFDGDPNTGIFRPAADQLGIATNGVERVEFGTTEVVFNDGGADVDFRVEGDTNASLFKIDAGLDQVQVANLNGGPLAGFRNRIINGDMRLTQRGPLTAAPLLGYTLDRWLFSRQGTGSSTVGQNTNAAFGGRFVLTASSTLGAGEIFGVEQRIEALNCIDLANQTITVSFWANATTTAGSLGAFTVQLAYAGSDDNWASDTQIASTAFVPTGTAQKFTLQFSVPGAATTGLKLQFSGTQSGATGTLTFGLGSVQLELGAVATPFEQRPIGTELALCQRYALALTSGQASSIEVIGHGYNAGAGLQRFAINFPTTMRATPTLAFTSGSAADLITDVTGSSPGAFAIENGSPFKANIARTITGGTAGGAGHLRVNGVSDVRWIASSEL
jgi:hypothetical protein